MSLEIGSFSDIPILDRFRNQSVQKRIPLQASLELTNRCNERCSHCYIPEFKDDQARILGLHQWQEILEKLREAGTLYVILMGGEAMLNPLFFSILSLSGKMGFHVSMISNGQKIQDLTVAQKLTDLGLINLTVSLYSHRAEVHDRMTRVRGSHTKTLRAIELCQQVGIEVTINCLLSKENIGDIFELEKWCSERELILKADPIITPKLNGNKEPLQLRASLEQLHWFYKTRAELWPNSRPRFQDTSDEDYVCNAAKGKCAVNAYGDLLPCIEIREPLGNLLKNSFSEIWSSPSADKWRNIFLADLKNAPEKKALSHCDHCPGMAKNESGDHLCVSGFVKSLALLKSELAENV